jgi:CBS domain-containing protein
MTPEPLCVDFDDSLLFAADRMVNANVRHLLVVADGRPVAMVSIRDIVPALIDVARSVEGELK